MIQFSLRVLTLFFFFLSSAFAAVNINTASVSELDSLPGIGPSKAAAIVAYREANGPFASCSALGNVKGIGSATLSNIGAMCTVGDGSETATTNSESNTTATPATDPNAININTAAASALESLPGIGPSKAAAIIAYREANGAFASCSALTGVQGIGSATVEKLASMCTTGTAE